MTYQLQTAVVEATTAHGSSLFCFSYSAAVTVMIMAVATVSLVEMMAADLPETIAHASLLFYFFCAVVAITTQAAVAADVDHCFHAEGEPLGSPFLYYSLSLYSSYSVSRPLCFRICRNFRCSIRVCLRSSCFAVTIYNHSIVRLCKHTEQPGDYISYLNSNSIRAYCYVSSKLPVRMLVGQS